MKRLAAALILTLLGGSAARAQDVAFGTSTATVVNVAAYLGTRVPRDRGPWVLGEVLFFSANRLVSDYTWRQAVRGTRGALYTNADIEGDVERLLALKKFDKVDAELYEIPGAPIPREFEGVAASTSEVRLVFMVTETATAESTTKPKAVLAPAPLSGVVLTPTAWRGAGRYGTPGMGLDINAAYYIGRLYGKNSFANAPRKTNYIDRLGVWLLTADGKMQIQSETALRPALAVGAQATALLRDSPQPQIQTETSLTVKASDKNAKILTDGYFVASKKLGPARTSLGVMQGTMGDLVASLSEFLTPEALRFYASRPGQSVKSRTVPYASLMFLPRREFPLAVEFMKFNGAPLNPWLMNFKIGYFLKLNFDVALLKYQGGYDVLGVLQFRYNYFPQR
ncbi:MAG: hypothetical protein PHF00_00435 [Elusimicrobia bacterium]|nr:hypothetical protein [Elusimicrobiota bacterium]